MPTRERPLAGVANSGGEDGLVFDGEVNGSSIGIIDERYCYGSFHRNLRGTRWEEEKSAEHVFVGLFER